jgi:hypothetical protein
MRRNSGLNEELVDSPEENCCVDRVSKTRRLFNGNVLSGKLYSFNSDVKMFTNSVWQRVQKKAGP